MTIPTPETGIEAPDQSEDDPEVEAGDDELHSPDEDTALGANREPA